MATQIQVRRDTLGDWNTANPILAQGEVGVILDGSNKVIGLKVGDGTSVFKDLENATPMLGGVPNQLDEDASTGNPDVADKTTFLLKGLTNQSAAVFGIEATGSTALVLSIDKAGGITAAAGVNVSGGYGSTGLTVSDAGAVTTNSTILADGVIQSGTYDASGGTSGAQLVNSTDHGQLLISSTDDAELTDVAIKVNTAEGGVADKFTVNHGGLVTCQGIVNTATAITMGGQKITGLNTAAPDADGDAATKKYVDDQDGEKSLKTYASCFFTLKNYGSVVPTVGSFVNYGNVASVVGSHTGTVGTKYCTITFTTPLPHATNWRWQVIGNNYPTVPAFGSVPMGNTTWTAVQTSASVITMSAPYNAGSDGPYIWHFNIVGTTLED
jgi:hypothetical protein